MCKNVCITNRNLVVGDFYEQITKVASGAADIIILREKDLSEEAYQVMAERVLAICKEHHACCILHSFDQVANRLGCNHIHVTMEKLRYMSERSRKSYSILGVSTHTLEEAMEAEQAGATYITASHIFPTDCKMGIPPRGLDYLKEVVKHVTIPVYALGGITPENQESCIVAGASGVCMMSYYMKLDSVSE